MMDIFNSDIFNVLKVIGKGTYGTVYLCEKTVDKSITIVKEINIGTTTDRDQYQDADNEVKIISNLSHPNIIQYYDSYLNNHSIFISMEYAVHGNLAEYMYKKGLNLVGQQEILFFYCQIVLGTHYIHTKNIIHRDLKAENILLTGLNGTIVKIGDFGIAKSLLSGQKALTVIGTPYYLAPELCDGDAYDFKTDIWALGCLLYEMCTHKRAFESETLTGLIKKITVGSVPPINLEFYERGMQDLIDSMLAVTPEKRPCINKVMSKKIIMETLYIVYLDAGNNDLLYKSLMEFKKLG